MPRNSVIVELQPAYMRWELYPALSHAAGVQHLQYRLTIDECAPYSKADWCVRKPQPGGEGGGGDKSCDGWG
jgi:hypothetical protein